MKDRGFMDANKPTNDLAFPTIADAPQTGLPKNITEAVEECEDCWKLKGSLGDGSCPKLIKEIHCMNCQVYSDAGRRLFEREPPEGYVAEWTEQLSRQKDFRGAAKTAVIIFRLGSEWLSLPSTVFKQIAPIRSMHTLPHRSGPVLMGLTNVLGALRLCVSLHELLGVEKAPCSGQRSVRKTYERLAVLEKEGDCWVFPLDEVYGMHRFHSDELQNVPVTVARSAVSYTKGLFRCEEMIVGLLDDDLLFYSLKRSIL
jgi:chemotaxis-related protein WspD